MFNVFDHAELSIQPGLLREMQAHRAQQFVNRLNWNLTPEEGGYEVDQYDIPGTQYCVVERQGCHAGSLRLRASGTGTMTEQIFKSLWEPAAEGLKNGLEVTRFCVSPNLDFEERTRVVADLLKGLCQYCLEAGVEVIYGVVFPAVARVIKQAGWSGFQLASEKSDVGQLILMEWRVSEFVTWQIEDRTVDALDIRHAQWARNEGFDCEALAA